MMTFKKFVKLKMSVSGKNCSTRSFAIVEQLVKEFIIFCLVIFISFFFQGCTTHQASSGSIQSGMEKQDDVSIYLKYAPEKVDILPLTEFVVNKDTGQGEIDLFVSLLDSFGSKIKSPCIFRFELYLIVPHSSEPKGQRIMLWTDVDLIQPNISNEYWRDFFRCYEFALPFEQQKGQSYVLEVTCMCPNNKRIVSDYLLKTDNAS